LVLNNGRPLAIPWADENIPAIVEGWVLGNAIAQVLYGDYNPSGKLPMTFQGMWGRYLFTTIIKIRTAGYE
jgi:beta-glucosidase